MQESKIFISHAKEDNHIVIRILRMIDDEGIKKWIDIEQLEDLDSNVNEKINEGLISSNHFLLIWSKNAARSEYVKKEFHAAISHDYDSRLKKIILRLDDTILPPLLADKKYFHVENDNVEEIISNILQKIKPSDAEKRKKFDNFLNLSYGKVQVVKQDYDTSVAFKRIDNGRYQDELQHWEENE